MTIWYAVILLCAIGIAALASIFPHRLSAFELVALVCVIGPMAAAASIYLVVECQRRMALASRTKREQEEKRRRIDSALAIADSARCQASNLAAFYKEDVSPAIKVFLAYDENVIDDIIETFATVSLPELGSFEAVKAFLGVKYGLRRIQRCIDRGNQESPTLSDEETEAMRRELEAVLSTQSAVVESAYRELTQALRTRSTVN